MPFYFVTNAGVPRGTVLFNPMVTRCKMTGATAYRPDRSVEVLMNPLDVKFGENGGKWSSHPDADYEIRLEGNGAMIITAKE